MKNITRISYFIFFLGLVLKLLQLNFNTIIILIGLFGVLIGLLTSILRREKKEYVFVQLASFCWLTLVLFSVKFFPNALLVFGISVLSTVLAVFFILQSKKKAYLIQLFLFISVALGFYFTPTDKRYYFLSIQWNQFLETDFITFDKYSWFLYQNDKPEEALKASKRAKMLADKQEESEWSALIQDHRTAIENRNWTQYKAIRH